MKVLLSWLQEFAPIEGDPVALGDAMSDLGMAVESMDRLGEGLDGIVVARVLDLRPHPDADRIQLVDVDAGDGEALQICCGAFNMAVGDLVPLATLGTTMPDGMEISRRKMRGEWSNGMLCSGRELGLGDDHSGIWILPGSHAPGTEVTEALGIQKDVLYDLEINPNRPDAMSVAGVARDLAARLRVPFALPEPVVTEAGASAAEAARVEILAPDLCGRFVARVLRGITVGESPTWVASRLTALGMRPINSVVDASNYVMLELGQPNHAYDLARLGGGGLRVRRARDSETLVTLDDVPHGIAGVMGGAAAEVSDTTSDVLLELAWFDSMSVARTSRRLGLRSEASARFEKGTDPEVLELAARRFAEILGDGATLAPGVIDERGELPERTRVHLRTSRVRQVMGVDLGGDQIRQLLEPIGFEVTAAGDDHDVIVPSFRPDTVTEIDVVEEVARHHGYGRIPKRLPRSPLNGRLSPRQTARRRLRSALVGLGLTEVMPTPFLAPGDLARAGLPDDGIAVTNPLIADESVMRTSLLPGLCKVVAYNASHRNPDVALFEVGHTYRRPADASAPLPDEREVLGVVLGGSDATAAVQLLRTLVGGLHLEIALDNGEVPGLHPTRAARVLVDGTIVGSVGEIDPGVLAANDVPGRVGWIELDLTAILERSADVVPYQQVRLMPSSDLDLAFDVADSVPADAVASALRGAAGDLLVGLELFDVFRGGSVAEGRRSLAYRLRFQAADHTLADSELAELRALCVEGVTSTLDASLRG